MFYCTVCKQKKGWPGSEKASSGECEVCGERRMGFNVPTKCLPGFESTISDPYALAAEDIMEDIETRSGIREQWDKIPPNVQGQIKRCWVDIIKKHFPEVTETPESTETTK